MRRVVRRPLLWGGAATVVMLAIAAPALGIRLAYPAIDAPEDLPVVSTIKAIQAAFPQSPAPAEVVITGQHLTGPAVTSAISRLESLAANGGPIREPVTVTPVADGRALIISVPLAGNGGDSASYAALDALRDHILPQTFGGTGVSYAVTGDTAANHDNAGQLSARTPLVLAVVAAVAFCLLLLSFRSVVLPLVSIALNFLSVAAAYGLITVIFQDGRLQGLLGYVGSGAITPWVPLFLFTFLFGISMDYHVFILSRIRELRWHGETTAGAVTTGIASSAGAVSSAALIMVAVFSIFIGMGQVELKMLGVGLAAAIALDATIVRGVLLPAAMTLLGDRCWYLPRWLSWLPGRISAEPRPERKSAGRVGGAGPDRSGNWATRGVVAAGRGIALAGLTLAGLALWVAFATAVTLAPLGLGLPAIPATVRAIRRLETRVRRLSGDWCGAVIGDPYRSEAAPREGQSPSFWARFGLLIADRATWRDLAWITVDALAGWLLTLTPAGLLAWGLFGVVMPAVWRPIGAAHGSNWYAFIHVTTVSTAWLSASLGIAFIALGLLTAPWLLRRYGALAQSLLGPTRLCGVSPGFLGVGPAGGGRPFVPAWFRLGDLPPRHLLDLVASSAARARRSGKRLHRDVRIRRGERGEVIGVPGEYDAAAGLHGRRDDVRVGQVTSVGLRPGEHPAHQACQRTVGITNPDPGLACQPGVDHLVTTGPSVKLGENDRRDDHVPVHERRGSQGGPDLFLPPRWPAAERGESLGVEDERPAHSSAVYFATSASSTGPYWASSESSISASRRFLRRRSISARMASFTCPDSASSAASSSATRSSSSETETFRFAVIPEAYHGITEPPALLRGARERAALPRIAAILLMPSTIFDS